MMLQHQPREGWVADGGEREGCGDPERRGSEHTRAVALHPRCGFGWDKLCHIGHQQVVLATDHCFACPADQMQVQVGATSP